MPAASTRYTLEWCAKYVPLIVGPTIHCHHEQRRPCPSCLNRTTRFCVGFATFLAPVNSTQQEHGPAWAIANIHQSPTNTSTDGPKYGREIAALPEFLLLPAAAVVAAATAESSLRGWFVLYELCVPFLFVFRITAFLPSHKTTSTKTPALTKQKRNEPAAPYNHQQ